MAPVSQELEPPTKPGRFKGLRPVEADQAMAVSTRTAYKWLARYRAEGRAGLQGRSCRPHCCSQRLSDTQRAEIIALRRQRRIYRAISQHTGVPVSTVARALQAAGLNRLSFLEPSAPVRRYEHEVPRDLLHLDIKKPGRFWRPGHRVTGDRQAGRSCGAGWDYVHVAIDYHSRVAHATLWPNETGASAGRH